jgi:hypothetical protein
MRGRGVTRMGGDTFWQCRPMCRLATGIRPFVGDGSNGVQQVAGGSRQPVEPRHRHHVARFKLAQQPAKLRAFALGSARHLAEHFLASGLGQLAHLCVHALAVRRYPRVARISWVGFCTGITRKKSTIFSTLYFWCAQAMMPIPSSEQTAGPYWAFVRRYEFCRTAILEFSSFLHTQQ